VGEKVSRRVLLGARKQDRGSAERGRDALEQKRKKEANHKQGSLKAKAKRGS